LKINSNKILSKGNKRNPLENLSFFWKNGSHSEIEISGCDKLPPLKGISPRDSGEIGLRSLSSEDKL
jgi:hypothetical protein